MSSPTSVSPVVNETEVEAPFTHSTGPGLSRFLTGLRDEQVIRGRRCTGCQRVVVPATDHCDTCAGELGEWVDVGPAGRVEGLTVVHHEMPLVGLEPPFAVVRVRLDGADTDLVHLAEEVDGLEVGARVRPVWSDEREGTIRDIRGFGPEARADDLPPAASAADSEPVDTVHTHLRMPFRQTSGVLQARFQESIRQGEIVGNRCTVCGLGYVPPREICSRCWARCEGWETVADHGAVTTFVVVNVPFYGQDIAIPYVLAQILLEGTDATVQHLIAVRSPEGGLVAPDGGVHVGMRVRAVWREPAERRGFINDDIDRFEPTGEPDADPATLSGHV